MKNYNIKLVGDNFNWEDIDVIKIDHPYKNTPDFISAYAQIAANENEIKVHLWTIEPDRRAVETGITGMPCEDSCLEFFFTPMENDKRYFNIEFNPNGCLFLGLGSNGGKLVRLLPGEGDIPLIVPTIEKDETRWDIYYKVSTELIRRFVPEFEIYENKEMMANCYKCSDFGKNPHYLAWSPVPEENLSFHQPDYFGKMKFVK